MRRSFPVAATVLLAASLLSGQSTNSGRSGGSTPAPNTTVNPAPQSSLVQILTPVSGEASASNAVQLRYQLTNPGAAAGEPNFRIQIDGADPITTTSTEYSFTGLTPGTHSIAVVLVDANGTPIQGGHAVVQFSVKNPENAPRTNAAPGRSAAPPRASLTPRTLGGTMDESPVLASNDLPALSLIGFGVLIGGVASAIRTRK